MTMKLYQISAWDALKICKRGAQNSWLNNIAYYMIVSVTVQQGSLLSLHKLWKLDKADKRGFIVIDIITFN